MVGVLLIGSAYAQNRRISGTVTSADDNSPMAGVSVFGVGTSVSTQTDESGMFSIDVPSSTQSLEFRFLGYVSQTVAIGSGNTVNVALEAESTALSEVVVTGYGTVGRQSVTGNIASIDGDELAHQPVQSFDQALGGKAAGAQISIPNGVVGNAPVFRIRGTNSISLKSYPLIIIDGVPTFTEDLGGSSSPINPLSSINPSDIENIEILKDASATAIYGSRAANGVMIVTTKRGRAGSSEISYDGWVSFNNVQRLPELLDAYEFTELKNEGLINAGTYDPQTNAYNLSYDANGNVINTNWLDYVYRTGVSHNHSASIRGGTEKTRYYGSAMYSKQQGIIIGNDYNKIAGLFNVDHKFAKIFTAGIKLNVTDEQNKSFTGSGSLSGEAFSVTGLGRIGMVTQPNVGPYLNDGSYNLNGNQLGNMDNTAAGAGYYNVAVLSDHNRSNSYTKRMQGSGYIQADPLPWLSLKSLYGIDNMDINDDIFQSPINGDGYASGGYLRRQATYYKSWVWTNTFDIQHAFNDHSIHLLGGNEQTRTTRDRFFGDREGLSDPEFDHIGAGFTTPDAGGLYEETYLVSFFGALDYDFAKKYYINGSLRYDEYSAFGPEAKGGTFYSIGAAYAIENENFFQEGSISNVLSRLRVRGSYGTVGNFNGLNWLAPNSLYAYGLYGGVPALYPSSAGNQAISWETSKKLDIGVNVGFLNNRITLDAAYFRNNVDDLIYNVPQAPSAGLPTDPAANVGAMVNKGFEVTIDAQAINNENFSWSPSFNLTYTHNEVTALTDYIDQFTTGTSDLETASITRVGGPLGQIFVARTDGVDPATGRRIFINGAGERVFYDHGGTGWTYEDGSRAPAIGTGDQVAYANSMPRFFGGFNNTLRYKNFDMTVNFTFQADYSIYWGTRAGLLDNRTWNNGVENLNRWTTPGQITDIPRVVNGDNQSNGSAVPLDINVFSGDFLKLRDLGLGYTIPNHLLSGVGISNLRVYVNANNAFIFTKYPGSDPEVSSNGNDNSSQGVERNSVASGRSIVAGLNLTF